MSTLVRFQDWILDRDDIQFVNIERPDGEVSSEYTPAEYIVRVHLKDGKKYGVRCESLHNARNELNNLTAEIKPYHAGSLLDHYLVKQIQYARFAVNELEEQVKKLMLSYKKLNKKSRAK